MPFSDPVAFLLCTTSTPLAVVSDAIEAAECWEVALENRDGPAALIFARHALPIVRRAHTDENLSRRGAYVLARPRRVRGP